MLNLIIITVKGCDIKNKNIFSPALKNREK